MVKRTYILAENHKQFRDWCNNNGYDPRSPLIYYIKDFTSLYGLGYNDLKVVRLPGWEKRKDAKQILLTIDALLRANGTKKGRKMEPDTIFNKVFWMRAADRAVKSFFQGIVLAAGGDIFNVVGGSWVVKLSAGAGLAILSLATAIGSSAITGNKVDTSLVAPAKE